MKVSKIFLLSLIMVFAFGSVVFAQEEMFSQEVIEAVELDENIQAEDLGIEEPRILPDSPFYFLKGWQRRIREFFAFNPVVKFQLKEKFANEKLIELKKTIEAGKELKAIERAAENYQQEVEAMKQVVEKIKEGAGENPEIDKFLDKFVSQQLLHQRLLQKLENQVPPEAFEKIKEARERHLERFGEVMIRLENKERIQERIQERLEKNLQEIPGSEFKNFKNLEILKELEEKVPEEAREAIQRAQENILKRLKENLEEMSLQNQEKFEEYLDKISGVKEKQMEILENLKEKLEETPEIQRKIIQSRDRILERIKQEGVEQPAVCIALWDPVCGEDGKTYSNECFANLAGVEVIHRGECE